MPKNQLEYFDYEHKDYGLIESVPVGVSEGVSTLGNYVKSLGLLFNKEGQTNRWLWYNRWFVFTLLGLGRFWG